MPTHIPFVPKLLLGNADDRQAPAWRAASNIVKLELHT